MINGDLCDSIAISLKKIQAQNDHAIKECVTMIRESKDRLARMLTKNPPRRGRS